MLHGKAGGCVQARLQWRRHIRLAVPLCTALLGSALGAATATAEPAHPATTSRSISPQARARAQVAHFAAPLPAGAAARCYAPAGNPVPGTNAWTLRDDLNQYCATLRLRDQVDSPAFNYGTASESPTVYGDLGQEQAGDGAGHIHGGVPDFNTDDPFRTISMWTSERRGRVTSVAFTAADGAQLRGHIWEPPSSQPPPPGGYPGVVFTDGSLQAYQGVYYWVAEDLVAHGYEVLTYDPQGQGDSDLFPAGCPDPSNPSGALSCQGVPWQQNYNFAQGAEDSLSFFMSTPSQPYKGTHNPAWQDLNRKEVGIAGQSYGGQAVSEIGQCDRRVRAIVAFDNYFPLTKCGQEGDVVPGPNRSPQFLHAPTLAVTNDYFFNPESRSAPPNPHSEGGYGDGDAGYQQLIKNRIDSEYVALRGSTHLEYTYWPYTLPASELGERMSSYYMVAWFDQYLRGDRTGYRRLTATTFDDSADTDSIGAGTYRVGAATPSDPMSGNVPYHIGGMPVTNGLSFYFFSQYRLTRPGTPSVSTCTDMRAGCPARTPATP